MDDTGRRVGDETAARGTGDPSAPRTVFSLSEQETYDVGCSLARHLAGGDLVVLQGELGLGKTVLARGLAAGLGIEPEDVTSPSFTLVQEYRGGRIPMYHVDLYRLNGTEDLQALGLEELLASEGAVVVEWGERLPAYYRRDAIVIRLHDLGEGARRIELAPRPKRAKTRRGDA
jgi:tRNA threonylcarbamoyladenosine biosynthesis protein TsaE